MKIGPAVFVAFRSLAGRKAVREGGAPGADGARRRGPPRGVRVSGGLAGAVLGVALSLVPLVLVMVVSDGMIRGITDRYVETGTYHIQASLPGGQDSGTISAQMELVRAVQGVRAAYSEMQGGALAAAAGATHAAIVRAVDSGYFADKGSSAFLEFGEDSTPPGRDNEVLLGKALADALGVKKGGFVTIMTPTGVDPAGGEAVPKLSLFRVTGTVAAGYRDLDSLWAFVTPQAGARILDLAASRSFIGIKTADAYSEKLGPIRDAVAESFADAYPEWFDKAYIRTWPEAERSLYKSFSTTRALLVLIMAVAVLVAATNLGSALGAFVAERRQDIAVLRGSGASANLVSSIFLAAGLLTGAVGTFAGIAIGMLASWQVNAIIRAIESATNVAAGVFAGFSGRTAAPLRLLDPAYYLSVIPIAFDAGRLLLVAAASVLLCIVASVAPARRAGAMPPMELFRKT